MKKIFLALILVGLTQYNANAQNKCTCSNSKTHRTTMHRAKKNNTRTVMAPNNNGKYVRYTDYAVYGRVHMSNRVVCTTKQTLQTDPLAGIMAPVVTPVTTTVCEDKAYITKVPVAHAAVYTTKPAKVMYKSKNTVAQPCAYKEHNIKVSYCLQ